MAIPSIDASRASTPVTQGANALGQQDFLKILLAQLTYQDPLKPLDSKDFIGQLAQLTELEQTRQLNARVDNLLAIQSATQAVGLLGKTVEVGGGAVGQVTTLTFSEGQPRLTVRTSDGAFLPNVPLADISIVR